MRGKQQWTHAYGLHLTSHVSHYPEETGLAGICGGWPFETQLQSRYVVMPWRAEARFFRRLSMLCMSIQYACCFFQSQDSQIMESEMGMGMISLIITPVTC